MRAPLPGGSGDRSIAPIGPVGLRDGTARERLIQMKWLTPHWHRVHPHSTSQLTPVRMLPPCAICRAESVGFSYGQKRSFCRLRRTAQRPKALSLIERVEKGGRTVVSTHANLYQVKPFPYNFPRPQRPSTCGSRAVQSRRATSQPLPDIFRALANAVGRQRD
jgi:hypothetical protein